MAGNAQVPPPDCYIPIYKLTPRNPEGPYRHHGTGFLLLFNEHPVLVTAAHVVDDAPEGIAVLLPQKNEVHAVPDRFSKTSIPDGGSRADDFVDLAVLRLGRELAENIARDGQGYWPIVEADCHAQPVGPRLRFCGYPGQAPNNIQNRPLHQMAEGAQIVLQPIVFNLPVVPAGELPHGFLRETSLAGGPINFDADPHGMSGGPVFSGEHPNYRLAGVTTNYVERDRLFLATSLTALVPIVRRALN